ncbi:RcnB family protein [Erwinia sp. INIA-01]|uniref:RcnB family protein n=1 Tax=Erwinia sp. INIA01 TaxID=2991500 RepID=UPI002224EF99|nr:RcnB family protein [Erwinia sp. INIA01]MCW1876810.1 RcnB family protein [Erwinia sp. INIA01]
MKKTLIMALSVMMIASSSLSAFAQGPDNGRDAQQQPIKHQQQKQQQGNGGQPQQNQHANGGQPQRENNARPQQASHQQAHGNKPERQQPDFRKGRPLPQQYRGAGYQVNDWKKHGLKAPPSGHRWMNVNGNYVLIAIATGVIASVIAHQ